MARTDTLTNFLTDVAESIRTKEGTTEQIVASEFDTRIANLPSGGSVPKKGFIVNKWNSAGFATDITLVGFSVIGNSYFGETDGSTASNGIGAQLSNVNCNDELTELGTKTFYCCRKLKTIKLPSNLEYIGNYCFAVCEVLTLNELPASVTNIGNYCFQTCMQITNMTIPGNINKIGNNAFYYATTLAKLILPNVTAVPTLGSSVFSLTPIESGTGYIYVPDTLVDSFKSATNWSTYADQIKPISEMPTE